MRENLRSNFAFNRKKINLNQSIVIFFEIQIFIRPIRPVTSDQWPYNNTFNNTISECDLTTKRATKMVKGKTERKKNRKKFNVGEKHRAK